MNASHVLCICCCILGKRPFHITSYILPWMFLLLMQFYIFLISRKLAVCKGAWADLSIFNFHSMFLLIFSLAHFHLLSRAAKTRAGSEHLNGKKIKVAWLKSDSKAILAIHTHMVALNPRLEVTHNGHNTWKLNIAHVQLNDSGSYMCQGMDINSEYNNNRISYQRNALTCAIFIFLQKMDHFFVLIPSKLEIHFAFKSPLLLLLPATQNAVNTDPMRSQVGDIGHNHIYWIWANNNWISFFFVRRLVSR